MTQAQISKIGIGQAFQWNHDEDGASTREERLATAFHVNDMPDPFTADLIADRGRGEWGFKVWRSEVLAEVSKDSYRSKSEALDGLKDWLGALL